MSDTNLVQLAYIREVTPGVTPAVTSSNKFKKMRITSESLSGTLTKKKSAELRADRLTADLIVTNGSNGGDVDFELSYGSYDDFFESLMLNFWQRIAYKYNTTADSSITDVGTITDTYSVNSGGTSFKEGHLVRATGFANAANNQIFRVAASTSTTVEGVGLTLTAETSPPAGAQIEVIGFEGETGDIEATATGLSSTLIDFTTLGLAVGQHIKIGGSLSANRFTTSENNGVARITAIAVNDLTLDNLPGGWAIDSGSGKDIQIFTADYIRIGTTLVTHTIEKGYLGHTVPLYRSYRGLQVNTFSLSLKKDIVTGKFGFVGIGVSNETTTPLDATPVMVNDNEVYSGSSNVSRLFENGTDLQSPNEVMDFEISINNNTRSQEALGSVYPIGLGRGECEVKAKVKTYFGDASLINKVLNNDATSINIALELNGQSYLFDMPRIKFSAPDPNAGGANQDLMLDLDGQAVVDPVYGQFQISRWTYIV